MKLLDRKCFPILARLLTAAFIFSITSIPNVIPASVTTRQLSIYCEVMGHSNTCTEAKN